MRGLNRAWIAAAYADLTGSLVALPEASALSLSEPTLALLPTGTPIPPADTPIPPTDTPVPPEPPTAEAHITIVTVNREAEYVDIQNTGGAPQDLSGWLLLSERGEQKCYLGGVIQPGETLRIWAMAEDADQGGFNCGFGTNIWNNRVRPGHPLRRHRAGGRK